MKNINKTFKKISIFSAISTLIASITAYVGALNKLNYTSLVAGFILMLIAIPVHIFGKKKNQLYYLSYILNTIGLGLSIGSYYSIRNIAINIEYLLLPILISVAFSFISLLLIKRSKENNIKIFTYITVLFIIIIIMLIIFWISNESVTFYSQTFFYLLSSYFYILLSNNITEDKKISQNISAYSFGIYLLVTIIILAIISEGDISFDLPIDPKKKTKIKKL